MRAVVLRSLAVVGIGALILSGVLYLASTVDGRAPAVASIALTQPLPDEPARGLTTTSLEVTFTEAVDEDSAAEALSVRPAVEGAVSWSGSVMIFTPHEPLALATEYVVSVGPGVTDPAGNRMGEAAPAFSFETTGPPEVVETVPADGATEVALGAPITVRFSTLMDTASVEAALRLRPMFAHELRWSGQLLEIIPTAPLRAEADYRIEIGEEASEISGVALEELIRVDFRTIAGGLDVSLLVPATGTDGIAPTTPIAVFFPRAIESDSLPDEPLIITPAVDGSVELVDELGNEPAAPADASVLRFSPSGPLPANTTFEVVLAAGIVDRSGGGLAEAISWSFTTGAPNTTLSNQITFLSDRAGVPNLWAVNVDGTAAHQLSTELTPVLDYAVSPNGNSFVVGDGRRLVMVDADGTDRRVLTEEGDLEFDPTYAPDGQRIAFARADAETGRGLGIWQMPIPGDPTPIELSGEVTASPSSIATGEPEDVPNWLRAPRYAPEGDALAFVDPGVLVGIVDLENDTVVRVSYDAHAPPRWLRDGSAILVTGSTAEPAVGVAAHEAPVLPLEPGPGLSVGVVDRSRTVVAESAFGPGATVAAVAPDGRIAYLRDDGPLLVTDNVSDPGSVPPTLAGERIGGVAFAPDEDSMVVVVLRGTGDGPVIGGRIERVEFETGGRDILANDGWQPRWLP
ncbi:MAG: Ig-like domain-containing protein [Chloroflexota bacterium]|nr:Ig-like domain-containing protein [Chloroflexota bacterium]